MTYSVLLVYILMSGLFTPVNSMAVVARRLVILSFIRALVLTLAVRQYRKRAA